MISLVNRWRTTGICARLLLLCAVASSTACGDSTTETVTVPGYYRLVVVDGAKVPTSVNASTRILSGDLVLRSDGTAQYAVRGSFPFDFSAPVFEGSYSVSNNALTLSINGTTITTGTFGGDSLLLPLKGVINAPIGAAPYTYAAVFRRLASDPVPIKSGTYVMTFDGVRAIDGTITANVTTQYDTIKFIDGAFYRRSISQMSIAGGTVTSYPGTYGGNATSIFLYRLADPATSVTGPHADSLFVKDGALIRRIWAATTVVDQRYEKR